jgi:hypothetical protein
MGPMNGVMGDDSFGTELPQTVLQEDDYSAEKRMVKFSKTKEFQIMRDHIDSRIDFYQKYLPDGKALTDVPNEERGLQWVIANAVIGEFKALLNSYEIAAETLKESKRA